MGLLPTKRNENRVMFDGASLPLCRFRDGRNTPLLASPVGTTESSPARECWDLFVGSRASPAGTADPGRRPDRWHGSVVPAGLDHSVNEIPSTRVLGYFLVRTGSIVDRMYRDHS